MTDTIQQVEDSINLLSQFLPTIFTTLGLQKYIPYIQLIPKLIEAADIVKAANPGMTTTTAVTHVSAQLTPGMPNNPALAPEASLTSAPHS